jgi:two-component system nitrogen regulation sensor histidine kinase NtrY
VVPCDRRLLGQALTNLLQNAADAVAMRKGAGRITVAIEEAGDSVAIAVEDDGVGLPQGEERDRLTEPYVTQKAKGTGLGLAIVKKIMEDHGGRLALEDRAEGPGARALLTLPAGRGAAGLAAATASVPVARRGDTARQRLGHQIAA